VVLVWVCGVSVWVESRLLAFVANSTHIVTYDTANDGHLSFLSVTPQLSGSAWISVYPTYNPNWLLATGNNPTDGNGTISLFQINRGSGQLTRRSEVNSSGLNPAYVSFDSRGQVALVANYGEGDDDSTGSSVTSFNLSLQNGNITQRPNSVVIHYGSGPNKDRQAGPHPHFVASDPFGANSIFSTDLGLDYVFQYNLLSNGTLQNQTVPFWSPDAGGSGPRHFAFHPDRLFAYLVNEMGNTIDVYTYDSKTGSLTGLVQAISTLPTGFVGASDAAEVVVTPDGKFLYASNRGYDSIVGYYIDPTTQTDFHLKHIGWTTHRISTPRNFAIDPTGRLLLVGASTTNEIVSFYIPNDGVLVPTGSITSIAGAISIVLSESN